jgi:hypothetical protein
MLTRTRCTLVLLMGLTALLGVGCAVTAPTSLAAAPAPADVVFVIPQGTQAALERGEPGFQLPDEINV